MTRSPGSSPTTSSADNALAESFNASFKREHCKADALSPTNAKPAWPRSGWLHRYNTVRRHSRLGQRSPINYENNIRTAAATLAPAA